MSKFSVSIRYVAVPVLSLFCALASVAQEQVELHNAQVVSMRFLGETQPYRTWDPQQRFPDPIVRSEKGLLIEHKELPGKGLHERVVPNALPMGADPVWQAQFGTRSSAQRALDLSQDGMGFTSLNPADPCLEVGPNHVIQMINGGSGSYFQVFNKSGVSLGAQVYLDNFVGSAGGAGDPIVLYDALADRWLMSEFASSGNHLLVAVSTSSDPTGTWYAYDFTTPNFPDYPKYGVWGNMYFVTSNEGAGCPIYALDRTKMLAGDPTATAQRFTTPDYPTIGFQATTPITFENGSAPPVGAPAMLMRMADDAWSASIPNDRLELWTLTVDFTTPANSSLVGPSYLAVSPFDTELCGYTSFSCISQPGTTTRLDPLREVIMNRAQYRNFGTHESIVCNHVTDVSGTDQAGVRWYELRRTGGVAQPWVVYQEGTYAPDSDSRWMGAISINSNGDIGLAYSVSSSSTFPSLRYTGRVASDPLGQMTVAETSIVAGTSRNGSNRWGDYFSLDVDPANGSFWGTGCYNTTTSWKTRIFNFSIGAAPSAQVKVAIDLLLEGPYNAGTGFMDDAMRTAGLVPTSEPYTAGGYTFVGGGGETIPPAVLSVNGNNAIVDWVVVELRSAADNTNIVASRSALVQRDGDVVDLDGVSEVGIPMPAGNYFVAVRHRNHLGVMATPARALNASPTTIDLKVDATTVYGTNARKAVGAVRVLWAGNVVFDGSLKYTGANNDRDPILTRVGGLVPTNTATGYFTEDVNLNGEVKYTGGSNDRDPVLNNIGGSVPTLSRAEQLP